MPFNGSGTFLRIHNWENDAAAAIKIRADRHDGEDDNIASGLSQCITKDGQTTITANLPMATYRHTNVGDATARTHYARADQVQDGKLNWVVAGGTGNAITLNFGLTITALVDGQIVNFRASANNTGATTINVNSLGAKDAVYGAGIAFSGGEIVTDQEYIFRYNLAEDRFELIGGFNLLPSNNTFSGTNTFTGKVLFPNDGELTIATGAITVTGVTHIVDTEGDAASDNLDTINGGADGQILIISPANASRTVVLTDVGNVVLPNDTDISLEELDDVVTLQYNSTASKWYVLSTNKTVQESSTTVSGTVEKATAAEVTAETTDKNMTADNAKYHEGVIKAWVSFDGQTGSVLDSYNITSVTRNAEGDYSVSMAITMSSANYCALSGGSRDNAGNTSGTFPAVYNRTTTAFKVDTFGTGTTNEDWDYVTVAILGTLA